MGYLDIAVRSVLPAPARVVLFWALAVVAVLRLRPLSIGGLMLYANAVLLACAHVAWDKYALPMLATLWLLKSADRLDEAEPAPTPMLLPA
jgi:predicted membrane metal-binding protein